MRYMLSDGSVSLIAQVVDFKEPTVNPDTRSRFYLPLK